MIKSGLPRSVRKFIRKEKSRIRREFFDTKEAEKKIQEFVAKMFEQYTKSNDGSHHSQNT
jgi:hypothetical protein